MPQLLKPPCSRACALQLEKAHAPQRRDSREKVIKIHFKILCKLLSILNSTLQLNGSCLLSLKKAMALHSSTLAWKLPWTEEPGRIYSPWGSEELGTTSLSLFTFMHRRRKWKPTPVFLPGESQGRGSLVGCRLWGRIESDTTDPAQQQQLLSLIFKEQSFAIKVN